MLDLFRYEPQTVSLVCLLLLSFVLPMAASRAKTERAVHLAWAGQSMLAVAGLAVLLAPQHAYIAMILGGAGCVALAYFLPQLAPARAGRASKG
jgi:hypothetical protein